MKQYMVFNKEMNRVIVGGGICKYIFSGELSYVCSIKPILVKKTFLSRFKYPGKLVQVEFKDCANVGVRLGKNGDYDWVRLKGDEKIVKVYNNQAPSNSSRYFKDTGRVMLKGVGDFKVSDFELVEF